MSAAVVPDAGKKKQSSHSAPAAAPEELAPVHSAGAPSGLPLFLRSNAIVNDPHDAFEREADEVARRATSDTDVSALDARRTARSSALHDNAGSIDGGSIGSPLPRGLRARVETILGADLRDVRVHAGDAASRATEAVDARAFTHGRHIWLAEGESAQDHQLLAHEAAHVVQQTGGGRASRVIQATPLFLQRKPLAVPKQTPVERAKYAPPPGHAPAAALPIPAKFAAALQTKIEPGRERRPSSSEHAPPASKAQAPASPREHDASKTDAAKPQGADHPKESKPGKESRATSKGGAGAQQSGGKAKPDREQDDASNAAEDVELPREVAIATEQMAAPEPLEVPPLDADWPISGDLSADSLPKEAQSPSKTTPDKADTKTKDGAQQNASAYGQDSDETKRQTRISSELARRAYRELDQASRGEQEAFIARATTLMYGMSQSYTLASDRILRALDGDSAGVDVIADRARNDIENTVDAALLRFEIASADAAVAIDGAGRKAYGLINAGMAHSASQIDTVVKGLVSGHLAAFNSAILATRGLSEAARLFLDVWVAAAPLNYRTDGTDYLEAAKNETRQLRIPRFVAPKATQLKDRIEGRAKAWEESRDKTNCSLTCSYHGAMVAQNDAMAKQGRKSVAGALSNARKTLDEQTRQGRSAFAQMRRSFLAQGETQRRASKSRLASKARAALATLRAESHGAILGVQSSAHGALPSFWRGVQGFEQSVASLAPKGAPAVEQTAKRAPAAILDGIRHTRATLDERLEANRARHEHSVAEREDAERESSANELIQLDTIYADQNTQTTTRLDESVDNFVSAFNLLDGTVTRAAHEWAQPLDVRMKEFIAARRADAQAALSSLLTGEEQKKEGGGDKTKGKDSKSGEADDKTAKDECGHCDTDAKSGQAPGTQPPGAKPGADAGPKGLNGQVAAEIDFIMKHFDPATLFKKELADAGSQVVTQLFARAEHVVHAFEGGFLGTVDEEGVIAALRGLTAVKGRALDLTVFQMHTGGGPLDYYLRYYLGASSDDYAAASAYLRGDAVEGARLELKDSLGIFNDDEDRIEAVMRALSPEQLEALGTAHPDTMTKVRDALDGTDVEVFDALAKGDYAKADAYRMRDAVNKARIAGDDDAVHSAIEQYTGAPAEGDYRASEFVEMSADDRRKQAVDALGNIVTGDLFAAQGDPKIFTMTPAQRAAAYVTRETLTYTGQGGGGEGSWEMRGMSGANKDLAESLLINGADSVEARASRIGVELARGGDPDIMNLDKATFDSGFSADLSTATDEEKAAHRHAAETRARAVMLAAQKYADRETSPGDKKQIEFDAKNTNPNAPMADARVTAARDRLIKKLNAKFGNDSLKADLAAGLLTDTRPSPETAAMAMRLAIRGVGTNEEMLFRFTERMTRKEVEDMRHAFKAQTGDDLDSELGTFGKGGTFTELSGDDRLRMERAMQGIAVTDEDKLQRAAFALQQQRRETGGMGASLTNDTLAGQVMANTERRLEALAGGPILMDRFGNVLRTLPNFNTNHEYTGNADHDIFLATTSVALTVAEDYAKRVDAFADLFTTAIAIIGAVAAIILTGGAALPLIACAVATGLASMAVNYAMKGGRYGWEQAGIDLGMTAVQAITAGVGAQLGKAAQLAAKGAEAIEKASETLVSLSRIFTGNPVIDQIIIGGITGSISGLGSAALNEKTWEGKDPLGSLLDGLARGAIAGVATASFTQGIEALGRNGAAIAARAKDLVEKGGIGNLIVGTLGRGVGAVGKVVGSGLNSAAEGGMARAASRVALRGVTRAAISSVGAMAGRAAEIAYDASHGKYHGDIGDALLEMGHVGIQSALQGFAEGGGEAFAAAQHNQRLAAAGQSINHAREGMGLPTLGGHALNEAAEDLLFLHSLSRKGDTEARAHSSEHVAMHGGIKPTVATVRPSKVVIEQMREELLRHVSPELRAQFGDVPIRVMPEAEFVKFTRSESGRAVTIIEDGKPVVIVREHTTLAHLSDEGPHLVQSRSEHTRERVAQLAESTLQHWDNLDLDTQLDLYRNKIDLEIDAHQQIARSLERELSAASGDVHAGDRIRDDIERNEHTLRNLRSRLDELGGFTPARRAAIAAGSEDAPQYLEQAARLFSKTEEEVKAVPTDRPQNDENGPRFERTAEEVEAMVARMTTGNSMNNWQEGQYEHNEVFVRPANREMEPQARPRAGGRRRREPYLRVDSYILGDEVGFGPETFTGPEIHERYSSQLAEVPHDVAMAKMAKIVEDYVGATIANVPSNRELIPASREMYGPAGRRLLGRPVLIVHEQRAPVPHELLDFAERVGLTIRDTSGREYTRVYDHGDDTVPRATAYSPDDEQEALRAALLRHVPPELHDELGNTQIHVLRRDEYYSLTRSTSGPVVTIIEHGVPIIVVREGTPIARVSDEGPHLLQIREDVTGTRTGGLDERVLSGWDNLDLDRQIELYRTKLDLEIEAHEMIGHSLDGELAGGGGDDPLIHRDARRNDTTLESLRARLAEVEAITPERRAAILANEEPRPQYLEQPARLFSKGAPDEGGYPGQPNLRGAGIEAEAGSADALRQRHENWVENVRRTMLTPGTRPSMVEGEAPRPGRYPWHANIESAYSEYNALVERYGGRREVGIYRNVDTGEYMVALGSAVNVQAQREALRQETVLHFHPDYGPSLFHGPSGTDLMNTAFAAREAGRPITEFIEFNVPGQGTLTHGIHRVADCRSDIPRRHAHADRSRVRESGDGQVRTSVIRRPARVERVLQRPLCRVRSGRRGVLAHHALARPERRADPAGCGAPSRTRRTCSRPTGVPASARQPWKRRLWRRQSCVDGRRRWAARIAGAA